MKIIVKPLARILQLEHENARLRALVGEAPAAEPQLDAEPGEAVATATLVQKTDDLEAALGLIAEVIL